MTPHNNSEFNDITFKRRVSEALQEVHKILDTDKEAKLAGDVQHEYSDKYALANALTNTAIVSHMNIFDRAFGLTNEVLQKMIDSTTKQPATTLRFQAFDTCQFLKEQIVDVKSPESTRTMEETETTGSFRGRTKKSTVKEIVKRVTEFHWKIETKWELSVYAGTNVAERIVLDTRNASTALITQTKDAPMSEKRNHKPVELSLTWLLEQIDLEKSNVHFSVNTESKDTKTPRRNEEVQAALAFFDSTNQWMRQIMRTFGEQYRYEIIRKHRPALPTPDNAIVDKTADLVQRTPKIFVPVIALMEDMECDDVDHQDTLLSDATSQSVLALRGPPENEDSTKVLSTQDTARLLNEQTRTLGEALEFLKNAFPGKSSQDFISVSEAFMYLSAHHAQGIVRDYVESIQYIEQMLEEQLVAAIGKRVTHADLDQYVRYHNSKMLNPAPLPFCHAIRRPNRYPDGILSIESDTAAEGKLEPIETHVREVQGLAPLQLPLNAATTLELTGTTYLHGWLNHRFSNGVSFGRSNNNNNAGFQLVGRARQFSSFMIVVGTMAGPHQIQPKDAIILQNKDEVKIPLLLNEIPTAKEFKDAIESLSPEQQRFAKAYRSMQLESSVLGICVIQIKPQLESLLGLPHDSLTKEMKLTQELMEVFVDYQVPCDMLSYDGDNNEATTKEKIDNVKSHVKSVMDVIDESKEKQLKEQEMVADMAIEKNLEMFEGCAAPVNIRKEKKKSAARMGYGGGGGARLQQSNMLFSASASAPGGFGGATARAPS
ncbi:MAG: hypothetical protein SGILL_009199, partial [Bacillariaceae sp.]